jgi:hypothetical protein
MRQSQEAAENGLPAFSGHAQPWDEEFMRLRKENKTLRIANEILKKWRTSSQKMKMNYNKIFFHIYGMNIDTVVRFVRVLYNEEAKAFVIFPSGYYCYDTTIGMNLYIR